MAKQRFRDLKQGRVSTPKKSKKTEKPLYPYAKASSKIKAFITDTFMLLMPIMYIVFYLIMGGREEFAQHKLLGWLYILIPLILIETLFMIKTAQTPGYRAYSIQIIDEKTGEKPNTSTILLRNIYALFSFFSLFGWLIMFFRKDAKTLHDLLSKTAIVYTS